MKQIYISIWIFDFGPEKLSGLSRNEPHALLWVILSRSLHVKALELAAFVVRVWENMT